jgi:hypothetical protein
MHVMKLLLLLLLLLLLCAWHMCVPAQSVESSGVDEIYLEVAFAGEGKAAGTRLALLACWLAAMCCYLVSRASKVADVLGEVGTEQNAEEAPNYLRRCHRERLAQRHRFQLP